MKTLFVAGSFDDDKGWFSSLGARLYSACGLDGDYYNGGNYSALLKIAENSGKYDAVIWLAKIPEDKPRISATLKEYGNFVFVSSKRNLNQKLTTFDIVSDALKIKSNLVLEFKKSQDKYSARVLDPLGNAFLDWSNDFDLVGKVLGKRTKELLGYTRVRSECVGENLSREVDKNFLELIREYAGSFSNFINDHPEAMGRFMGNASFRCTKGFPSYRKDGLIYVSRRNVDKRGIESSSFVAVDANSLHPNYFGVKKPSVDTPIQLRLYQYYPQINFMLHSHNYIFEAKSTSSIIPCGALEEAKEIVQLFPDKSLEHFSVNLLGHGSIIASKNLQYFKEIKYFARPIPEIHKNYSEELR